MTTSITGRARLAADRFRAFFEELGEVFLERDDVLRQIALALLCKEHVLVTGPPGTAKSALANAVFGRIVCAETGRPSVYARQITESTVQTDLIGPIDFKNLMASGRTTYFTDEGILGANHAFLDEVFDGRDMLLRAAFNVLQERELKQGTTTTRGRIECALMTSNRYIADVIERSRETLLAFVDRIAFIGFVPRGFADRDNLAKVLERHVGRGAIARLDALLTLQDVDALQELTDAVTVSPEACDGLARLLGDLDEELHLAARGDPEFLPTRYLSTRTAVRSGKVLRAIAVYHAVFGARDRPLEVQRSDFDLLRLHLLLSGPSYQGIEALLAEETNPNERRQLHIARVERELYDRSLGRLPDFEPTRPAPASTRRAPAAETPTPEAAADPLAPLCARVTSPDVDELCDTLRRLAEVAAAEPTRAEEARALMARASSTLGTHAVRAALGLTVTTRPLVDALHELAELADRIEDGKVSTHGVAQGLRAHIAQTVAEMVRAGPGAGALAADGFRGRAEEQVARLESLARLRRRAGVADDDGWREAVRDTERDVAILWDAAFCAAVEGELSADPNAPLDVILGHVSGEIDWLIALTGRLSNLGAGPSELPSRAAGRRLSDLVGALMSRVEALSPRTLHEEIARVQALLAAARLGGAISVEQWLGWATRALVRAHGQPNRSPVAGPYDYDGYRRLRDGAERTPLGYVLCEVALRVAPSELAAAADGGSWRVAMAELCGRVPDDDARRAGEIDLARVERAVDYLDAWWDELVDEKLAAADQLERLVRSRYYQLLWDERVLDRSSLEIDLTARLFPPLAERAEALARRVRELERRTLEAARALLVERTDAAWRAALPEV